MLLQSLHGPHAVSCRQGLIRSRAFALVVRQKPEYRTLAFAQAPRTRSSGMAPMLALAATFAYDLGYSLEGSGINRFGGFKACLVLDVC